jgi:hypothetical protein
MSSSTEAESDKVMAAFDGATPEMCAAAPSCTG